ncbi:hypothetical protein CTI12_AA156310 [Artemisia annua]|uniref:SWIM-type domain-containing protein n=1 Tax=Artemisia annua TaxID=35608 RepID=A0A2U1PGC1_ARTAN|nr:hypothetical protein CTI12_AA156310 [Artemisia annua]
MEKDEDVNGLYYRQSAKTLTDGLRLIHDEASLYEMLSCTSRTGLVELYVEHSEDWLQANNKLIDMNVTTGRSYVSATSEVGGVPNETQPNQNMVLTSSDKDEGDEEDGDNSTEEGDVEGDYLDEIDTINETLDPNQDTEVAEKILEDGTTEMMRTRVKFPRYDENCKTVSFLLAQSFTDHMQFKKALLKYAYYAANVIHNGKKYFLVKTLNEKHTCSKVFVISHLKSPWIAEQWETMIYAHPGIKSTYIQETIKAQLELEVTKNQCKKAKAKVMKKLERDVQHEYRKLYDYASALLKVAFYAVAKCANEAQLKKRLDEIDNIQDGAKQTLENRAIQQWCRAYFKTHSKCDSIDNNSTEAWNFVLIAARSKPIISMNEDLREYLMERRIKRLNFARKWRLDYGPNIRDIVNENSTAGCKWKIKWNGDQGFQVYYGTTQHCVHIGNRTCSCGRWELSGIPCCHATAAIRSRARDPFEFVDKCYSKDKFIAAYSYPIEVVGSEEFWPNSGRGELLPPLPKAMPGRPRKARRKRKFEPKKSKTKLSRHGRDMHCGICKSSEHNKRTCSLKGDAPVA